MTRAAAEVSQSKEDLLISQTNVAQQETILKNALSRNGIASPWLDDVHIFALDRIVVPEKEDLKPTADLIQQALTTRPEIEQTKINIQSSLVNLGGSKNALLPSLQAFAEFTNNALSGRGEHHLQRFQRPGGSVFHRRLRQFSGADVSPEFPELHGRLLAEHSIPQSRRRRPTTLPISSRSGRANCNCNGPSARFAWT